MREMPGITGSTAPRSGSGSVRKGIVSSSWIARDSGSTGIRTPSWLPARRSGRRPRIMQIGIHLPHIGRKAGPDAIRRAAIQAEELGFADVWVSEHIIIPKGAPYPPSPNFWDPVLTLTWAAAFTRRVKLGTSVLVLPMRRS